MSWPCYWMEDTGTAEIGLRRYATPVKGEFDCAGGYHQAFAWLGLRVDRPRRTVEQSDGSSYEVYDDLFEADPNDERWPVACDVCGTYSFTAADFKQTWHETIFVLSDGSEASTHWAHHPPGVAYAGAGAMWDAWWLKDFGNLNPVRPDGIHLMVRCPNMAKDSAGDQDWAVDVKATGGGYWSRIGDPHDPRSVTVRPSISIGDPSSPGHYHGWLSAGVLTDHIG